ncbi:MAG: hypothetical protein H6706_29400 [Myxococcales bacterium]|nr:hypothetical protein [Myxococcales bacterium]
MRNTTSVVRALACFSLLFAGLTGCNQGAAPADAPKADAPKADAPKADAPKADAPKADAPKADNTDTMAKAAAPAPAGGAAQAAPAEPTVTLLEAGAAPQQTLRLKLKQGDSMTAEMVMKMKMKMNLNGMQPPEVPLPPTRMLMKMEVIEATADRFGYTFEVTEAAPMETPGVQPMVMSAMENALKGAVGLKGKGAVDHRGMNKGASFELPPNMDPQTRQLMDGMRDAVGRMSAPLPNEAVGVGGKWKVDQTLEQNGMKVNQTATYTVKSIDGDKVNLGVEVAMEAPAQEVKAPGMPEGAKMHLESLTGKGTGNTTQNLTQLLPQLAEVQVDTAMKSMVEAMGQKQNMSMEMSMDVTIKPAG